MNEIRLRIIEEKEEIIKYLQLGTNIPIWEAFHKYILDDLLFYEANLLLLLEDGNPVGTCLIFDDNNLTLYFGFFRIINHKIAKIDLLINQLLNYAKEGKYEKIIGPINIPTIIYGWGFLDSQSENNLFIAKPVNPPIYQKLFLKHNFNVRYQEDTWTLSPLPIINPYKYPQYDYSNYEFFYPRDYKEFLKLKVNFLEIQASNLPPSSRITPNNSKRLENYAKFIFDFGYNFMIFFVKYKPDDRFIACGAYIPNPFRKNKKGVQDSCHIFTWAVETDHRKKGVTFLMYGAESLLLKEKGIRYGCGPISEKNTANIGVAKKLGAKKTRKHKIMEFKF
jgi:hypothetical protein